jgi:hypothetical protein
MIAGDTTKNPAYGTASVSDLHVAAVWYSGGGYTIDVNLTDGGTHQVALYAVDWDSDSRNERFDVVDASNGTVLDTQTISGFNGGQYVMWNVKGHVTIRVSNMSGMNAVASGVFFR